MPWEQAVNIQSNMLWLNNSSLPAIPKSRCSSSVGYVTSLAAQVPKSLPLPHTNAAKATYSHPRQIYQDNPGHARWWCPSSYFSWFTFTSTALIHPIEAIEITEITKFVHQLSYINQESMFLIQEKTFINQKKIITLHELPMFHGTLLGASAAQKKSEMLGLVSLGLGQPPRHHGDSGCYGDVMDIIYNI